MVTVRVTRIAFASPLILSLIDLHPGPVEETTGGIDLGAKTAGQE